MEFLSALIITCACIVIVMASMLVMMWSINQETCKPTTVLSYDATLSDFNGTVFITDSGRYSAEIIARAKIHDVINHTPMGDTLDIIKKIDSELASMRDDVVYNILITTSIDENPRFVYIILNNPDYRLILMDYNKQLAKFGRMGSRARALAMSYKTDIPADASDTIIYNTLLNG
jgi:hypothetical protein